MTPLFLLIVAFLAATGGLSFPHGDVALSPGDVSFPHGDASFSNGGGLTLPRGGVALPPGDASAQHGDASFRNGQGLNFANGGVTPDSPTRPGGTPGRFYIPVMSPPDYTPPHRPWERRSSGGYAVLEAVSQDLDMSYLSKVSFGTPPQELSVHVDTGSSFSWVFGKAIDQSDKSQYNNQTLYDPQKSSSSTKTIGTRAKQEYGDNSSVVCDLYLETVTLDELTIPSQVIGAARRVSQIFAEDPFTHGVLGLGPRSKKDPNVPRAAERYPTLLEKIIPSLRLPVITINLNHHRDHTSSGFTFGFIEHDDFLGELKEISVDASGGFYEFNVTDYAIGKGRPLPSSPTAAPPSSPQSFPAFVDTGAADLKLPRNIVRDYYSHVNKARVHKGIQGDEWIFPCSSESIPCAADFSYRLGDYQPGQGEDEEPLWITIPGRHMDRWSVEVKDQDQDGVELWCIGPIQEAEDERAVFRIPALRAAFVALFFSPKGEPISLGWAAKEL